MKLFFYQIQMEIELVVVNIRPIKVCSKLFSCISWK